MPAGHADHARLQRAGAARYRRGDPAEGQGRQDVRAHAREEREIGDGRRVQGTVSRRRRRFTVELPRSFKDDAGREPENKASFPLATATDEYPPLAKFPGRFGILELNADPLLPVTVRNVEAKLGGRRVEHAVPTGDTRDARCA